MVQIYRAFAGLIPLMLLVLLLGVAIAGVVVRRRAKRLGSIRGAVLSTAVEVVAVGNLAGYAILTLTPGYGQARSLNLVPFYEVYQVAISTSGATAPLVEIIGNAMLLMPFAALAGLRWKALDSMRATAGAVCVIALAVESLQLCLGLGRVASVTDVLLPTLGAVTARVALVVIRALVSLAVQRPRVPAVRA